MITIRRVLTSLFSLSILIQGQAFSADSENSGDKNCAKHETSGKQLEASKSPSAAKSSKTGPAYVKQEPISDKPIPATRVRRPGQQDSDPSSANSSGSADWPMPVYKDPPPFPVREKFPTVARIEDLMFGRSSPDLSVEGRLEKLENAVFQHAYPELDVEQRIAKLKEVVAGEGPNSSSRSDKPAAYAPSASSLPVLPDTPPDKPFAFPNYGHYDMEQSLSVLEAEKFALEVVNEIRSRQGLNELYWDDVAYKVAVEQIKDQISRGVVSHHNSRGENPDLRYTKAGGQDSLFESSIMFPAAEKLKLTRQLVVGILDSLFERRDDRDAFLNAHCSGFALSFSWTEDHRRLNCCAELVTKHGQMDNIPLEATVGDRIELKGSIAPPYKFHKITLAWEKLNSLPPDEDSELTDALPYFPPLDYEAHSVKSNRDFEKGIRVLQIAGITAAIAGGLFIPPVALAAPLIAASVGPSTPKPVSEIPVKGGVKTDGSSFSHRLTLSNQGKEGLYYVTIWASTGAGDEILPVSRRAIIARKTVVSEKAAEMPEKEQLSVTGKTAGKKEGAKFDSSKDNVKRNTPGGEAGKNESRQEEPAVGL